MKTIKVVAAVICDNMLNKSKIFATARGYGEYKGWWEFPGGKIEVGEDPRVCAIRELHEETWFEASEVIDLGKMVCSPGYDSEIIYLYAARGLNFIGEKPDEGEFLNCEKIPLKELLEMADKGLIADSKTQLCLYKTVRRLGIEF